MIYVDQLAYPRGKTKKLFCHLFGDSVEELRSFAATIGRKDCWFHRSRSGVPHYDLDAIFRAKAVEAGAVEINTRSFLLRHKQLKLNEVTAKSKKSEAYYIKIGNKAFEAMGDYIHKHAEAFSNVEDGWPDGMALDETKGDVYIWQFMQIRQPMDLAALHDKPKTIKSSSKPRPTYRLNKSGGVIFKVTKNGDVIDLEITPREYHKLVSKFKDLTDLISEMET